MRSGKVLISMKTYLGDAVMALPAIEALESEFQDVTIQTSPSVQHLLQDPIRSRRFVAFEKGRSLWTSIRSSLAMRREGYETVVLVNRSFRAAFVARLAGISCRVGHDIEGRRWLLNRHVPYDDLRFEAETCLDLARALGCEGVARPRIMVPDLLLREGKGLVGDAEIGIQPGTRYVEKRIPLAALGEVVCSLIQDGRKVVLVGGPEEAETTEQLQRLLPKPAMSLVGKTDIRQTMAAVANLRLVIGGDTGLMHVAVATGASTLTVFGPTNFPKWAHQYPPHRSLVAPDGDMSKTRASDILDVARTMAGG